MLALKRIIDSAKCIVNEQDINDVVNQCGCHRVDSRADRAFDTRHLPTYAGEVVFADILYPVQRRRDSPAVLFTDALTRYCSGEMVKDCARNTLVDSFIRLWQAWVGPPRRLVVDSGSNFSGSRWAMLSNLVGVNIVVAAVDSHHTVGRVGRNVQIVHKSHEAIHEASEGAFSPEEKFTLALLAHNMTPNSGRRIAPLTALNGRPGFIDQLSHATVIEAGGDRYDSEENSRTKRLLLVKKAQARIIEFGATRTIQLCLRKNAMVQSQIYLHEGGAVDFWIAKKNVDFWIAKKKRWQGTFRVIYDSGSSVLVGNLGSIF